MSQEEIPAEPDDNEQLWEVIKQSLAGSVLDQVTAFRQEALDTANTALKLAADAELRAASSDNDLSSRIEALTDSLGQLIVLHQQQLHTQTATVCILRNWTRVLSYSSMAHIIGLESTYQKQKDLLHYVADAFDKFEDLMNQALLVRNEESANRICQLADTLFEEYSKYLEEGYQLNGKPSQG